MEGITTREDVQRLVDERIRERDDLEFKRALPPPSTEENLTIARDLMALANNGLGTLIYGVAERAGRAHKLHPFDLTNAAERVASIARERVDEALTLADVVDVPTEDDGTGVLVVQVDPAGRAPYFVDGQALGRSGPRNVSLSRAEVGRLFAANGTAFLEEFKVRLRDPARPRVRTETEQRPKSQDAKGKFSYSTHHRLYLRNEGGEDAHDVLLSPEVPEGAYFEVLGHEGPVAHLLAGQELEFPLLVGGHVSHLVLHLTWKDDSGEEHTVDQSVTA